MARMLHVGLTGNIASGKSNATHVFAELGAHTIDADVIAHELMTPGKSTYKKVVDNFGTAILDGDGNIRRKELGRIIFHDPEKRLLLNSLVHPDVRNEVLARILEIEKKSRSGIIIVDAALMVESGFYKFYDKLIVVHCDRSLQLARIISRDGLSLPEARERMEAQMPTDEKLKYADFRIDTSGTFRQTRVQIEEIYRRLLLVELEIQKDSES